MRNGLIAPAVLAIVAVAGHAHAAPEAEPIGVKVRDRTETKIPVRLSCPAERMKCWGTISFKGRKRRGKTTYRLSADPYRFKALDGGDAKTIDFQLSPDARRTLAKANGITATFVVRGRYSKGPDDTVRVSKNLPPRAS